MRKIIYSFFLLFISFGINAQISTGMGGAASVLPNNPTTNNNVGIGTANPSAKLEVDGDIKGRQGFFTNSLSNTSTFISSQERNDRCLVFSAGALLGSGAAYLNTRMLQFYDFPQSNIDEKSLLYFILADRSDNNRLTFYSETGGTSSFSLDDKSQSNVMAVNEDGEGNVFMHFPKPNSRVVIGGWGNYLPEHKFVVRGSAKIEGNILTDANLGIGTSNFTDGSSTYRLSVKGKVRAEEVKVYNSWADYVFSPAYKLTDLKEVETYINKNGHLKNVPSAKEITEKGLALGEMTKIQQEKIEELTLYLIQQNKEIEELKAQVKLLLKAKLENANYLK